MLRINLIAAVGRRGQLGLNGEMPWTKDAEDLRFFRIATKGSVVVFGNRTFDPLFCHQPVWSDRMVLAMGREGTRIYDGGSLVGYWEPGVDRILHKLADKDLDVWVAGGAETYRMWLPHVRRCFITKMDYDGDADTWMPRIWNETSIG